MKTIAYLSSVTSHIPNKMMRHTSSTHDVKYTTESYTITIAVRCARCVVYSTRVIAFSAQSRMFINTHPQKSLLGSVYFMMWCCWLPRLDVQPYIRVYSSLKTAFCIWDWFTVGSTCINADNTLCKSRTNSLVNQWFDQRTISKANQLAQ